MEYRRFGRTNEKISVITLGGMRFKHGWNPPRSHLPKESIQNCIEITRQALGVGINHIETAHGYMKSENLFGVALKELGTPRDQFKMMTKGAPMTGDETRALVEEQLKSLKIDYLDFYGWHGINNKERLQAATKPGGPVEVLHRLREEGVIRHVGFSTHAPLDIILQALNTDLFSFVNLHYYYFFQRNLEAVRLAGKKDIGVFIISPNEKGGMLWKPSGIVKGTCEPMSAIQFNGRFCLGHPEITTLSMGMHEPDHFPQNLSVLSKEKIYADNEPEIRREMDQRLAEVKGLCTLCSECLPCPEEINIPEVLRFRNLLNAYEMEDYGKFRYNMFEGEGHWFPGNFASKCTECGDCLPRCPEKLEIPRLLFETHRRLFDRKAWLKSKSFEFAASCYKFFKRFVPWMS
ncbi:MAG: aldo/keto reductase [Nitrospinae bacterium]|nr:aldo/keto reductase [Nitrospinota bacterium]MZH05978.1 aldo/keto reductase [Nitrospinota bacterium]MZH15056.1 aldo/keto reductase [Nitrospinota bacterium]